MSFAQETQEFQLFTIFLDNPSNYLPETLTSKLHKVSQEIGFITEMSGLCAFAAASSYVNTVGPLKKIFQQDSSKTKALRLIEVAIKKE